jgi:hypothetical protein
MEVHHHAHTPRKKWTHYFWEFLMLFLAVFAGFLAENAREHYIEHLREKQFMRSLYIDLKNDTTELGKAQVIVRRNLIHLDSMLVILTSKKTVSDSMLISAYGHTFPAMNSIRVALNDRTITQLKNAGNMRLIRSQEVNDGLISYWGHFENIRIALERHNSYRSKARDQEIVLFEVATRFLHRELRNNADTIIPITVINNNPILVREYTNILAYCGIRIITLDRFVARQKELAAELIATVRKEYRFK